MSQNKWGETALIMAIKRSLDKFRAEGTRHSGDEVLAERLIQVRSRCEHTGL